jgi:hypothetical protein
MWRIGVKDRIKRDLDFQGFALIEHDEALFLNEEWDILSRGIESEYMSYERVIIGDAGEPNCVEVGRLMTDIDRPMVVNNRASEAMLEVIGSKERMKFFADIMECGEVSLRRAQINKMHTGSYIGLHVDQDSNPDYGIAIVLQFGSSFSGGEFVVHDKDGNETSVSPPYGSMIISKCDWAHEVRPVTSGTRTSLVFFVSPYRGDNRRVEKMESVLA